MLNQKIKAVIALIIIGSIGFILGATANLLYYCIFPLIIEFFPYLFKMEWIIWGLAGALLAIICCIIYVYLP